MRRPWPVLGTAIGGILVFACNALTGASDLREFAEDGGLPDAPVTPPAVEASVVDAPVVVDAPPDTGPPPPCPSAGRSCVNAPPDGWEGPFLVYEGRRDAAPDCPAEMPELDDDNVGEPAGTIACSGCSCGPVTGAACTASLSTFGAAGCSNFVGSEPLTSTCLVAATEGYLSARLRLNLTTPGSCAPSVAPTGKVKSAVTWPDVVRLCGKVEPFAADGCPADQLCVPDGVAPFKPHTCIASLESDAQCPAPWTVRIQTKGETVDDTRDCATNGCSCAAPTDVGCAGVARNFPANATCTNPSDREFDGDCFETPAGSSQRLENNSLGATGGNCAASGTPTATGGVAAADDDETVCCLP